MTIDQALDDLVAYAATLRDHWPPDTVADEATVGKAWRRITAAIQTLTPAMPR